MTETAHNILVVDDDPTMRHLLKSALSADSPHLNVLCAQNAQEALQIIARIRTSLVISDIIMPGMSGLDLMGRIREQHPAIKVILMTAHASQELDQRARQSGCLHFLRKPIDIHKLKELITSEIGAENRSGFSGLLTNIQLPDLLQMCCYAGVNTAIRVHHEGRSGTIYINEGQIVHAAHESEEGMEAFFHIFMWQSGHFRTLGEIDIPKATIDRNWQYLLMEGHRRMDEADAAEMEAHAEKPETAAPDVEHHQPPAEQPEPPEASHPMPSPPASDTVHPSAKRQAPKRDPNRPIQVLLVEPSEGSLHILARMLSTHPMVQLVETVQSPEAALETAHDHNPDLILLDIDLPAGTDDTPLKRLVAASPFPVLLASDVDSRKADRIMELLFSGAVDLFRKPGRLLDLGAQERRLVDRLRLVADAETAPLRTADMPRPRDDAPRPARPMRTSRTLKVVLGGAGGYRESVTLITGLPRTITTCIILIQTLPDGFHLPFTRFLASRSEPLVEALTKSEPISQGRCFAAVHDIPLTLIISGKTCYLNPIGSLQNGDAYHGMPDRFLKMAADVFREQLEVMVLSGAEVGLLDGLINVRAQGGRVYAQRRDTCLIPAPIQRCAENHLISREMAVSEMQRRLTG